MKSLSQIKLMTNQLDALKEIRTKLSSGFDIKEVILFGSAVRNVSDSESDLDLLVITQFPISRNERHLITDLVFEVNLNYATNFSTLVVDEESWNRGLYSVLPINNEILSEGIQI
ncbi:MAG: nucleotidyltransferase domain-containing protein [Bacteroidota bacterium]